MTTATATKPKASSTTLKIPKAELAAAVASASKALPSRGVRPILANLRVGDGLVTGTDLEVRIDVEIGEMCDPFLVPADRLASILRESRGDEVTLTAKGASVAVKCGGGKWELPTEDVNEYPTWEPVGMKDIMSLPADQFRRATHATTYATDTESSRYALGSVLVECKQTPDGNAQYWVATDGRRLAYVETQNDQALDASKTLIPARVLSLAEGMATGSNLVQVSANERECQIVASNVTITGRLVEGRFPPTWEDLVKSKDSDHPTVLERSDWLAAVRAAAIVTSEQSKGIDLEWTADTLVISGRSAEYGESTVQCDIVAAGTSAPVKLDPRFIIDFLRHLPDDEEPQVDVYVKDGQSRVLITCGPYKGVIMPLAAD